MGEKPFEITSEMILAGADIVEGYDPNWPDPNIRFLEALCIALRAAHIPYTVCDLSEFGFPQNYLETRIPPED